MFWKRKPVEPKPKVPMGTIVFRGEGGTLTATIFEGGGGHFVFKVDEPKETEQ